MRRVQTFARAVALAAVVALSAFPHPTGGASAALEDAAVVIDFSHAGYGGGGVRPPALRDVVRVRPSGGDDTALIQAALDRAASARTFADARGETLLVYTPSGESVTLAAALPRKAYAGLWFDPRTGATRPLDAPRAWGKGTTMPKPTGEDWLLLLTSRDS